MSTPDPLPPPPWSARRTARPARTKPPITREAIVAAALPILDAEGLDALSMRRVADALGTGPASLYQHVSGKDELLELLFDAILRDVKLPEPSAEDWQTPLKQLMRATRATLVRHRDIAYVSLGRIPTGPNALIGAERMLLILRTGGVPEHVAAFALDALSLFVSATAYEESIRTAQMGSGFDEMIAYVAEIRDYFKGLPVDRFPTLVAMADALTSGGDGEDARFEFALDVQIRGIAALAADAR